MMHCKDCDYFLSKGEGHEELGAGSSFCRFMDHILPEGVNPFREYPCKDTPYSTYLGRRRMNTKANARTGENWKLLYISKHPVKQRERVKQVV